MNMTNVWNKNRIPFREAFLKVRKYIVLGAALMLTGLALPSQTQVAYLVAGYYTLRAIDSPEAAKIKELALRKANEYLDKELKK